MSTYIFGAICPQTGAVAGLVLPWCNTEAMGVHLAEVAARVTPGRHCALLADQAGWHMSAHLAVPANITIVLLPAKCPELNPVENVWQFMRNNWLSDRVFTSYDAIIGHCCDAWPTNPGASCLSGCATGRRVPFSESWYELGYDGNDDRYLRLLVFPRSVPVYDTAVVWSLPTFPPLDRSRDRGLLHSVRNPACG